jgi:hypothetical protein
MGEGSNPVGTAPSLTDNLLNVGVAVVQAQTAKKIAEQNAQISKDANKAAISQANAITNQANASQNIAALNAQAMSANTKKWMWIIGGSVVGIAVLGFIYFRYIKK